MYFISVHTGTYLYVPVHTAINQVYRIPDAHWQAASDSECHARCSPSERDRDRRRGTLTSRSPRADSESERIRVTLSPSPSCQAESLAGPGFPADSERNGSSCSGVNHVTVAVIDDSASRDAISATGLLVLDP
jgi:hypothetical protein